MTDSQVLKRLEFPAYCVRVLDNGLIAVAGGGGTAKTGVGNCIELGIIDYSNSMNENTNTSNPLVYNFNHAQFHSIHKFEPNDAIMKFTSFTYDRSYKSIKKQQQAKLKTKKNGYTNRPTRQLSSSSSTSVSSNKPEYDSSRNDLFLAAAVNDSIEIYKIQPTIDKSNSHSGRNRARRSSSSQSNQQTQLKPNGINHHNHTNENNMNMSSENNLKASAFLKLINIVKLAQPHQSSSDLGVINDDDVFDDSRSHLINRNTNKKPSLRKTPSLRNEEESIETLAVCNMMANPDNNEESSNEILLCAGTSKGNIVIWNLTIDNLNDSNNNDNHHQNNNSSGNQLTDIKSNKLKMFKEAHGKQDIDELQVNQAYLHLLSIGKNNHCYVWSLKNLDKLGELDYAHIFGPNSNLRMKHARYANNGRTLYTTYIPRVRGGKIALNSYLQKWLCTEGHETLNYTPSVKHCVRNTILTSIQSSKDGNVVCCGDYEGKVYLFDSNFSTLADFKRHHSCVVTDLAFYHDSTSSMFNSNNKLILSLSIDRTLQCYTYLDTNNTFKNKKRMRTLSRLCSMNTFKLVFILISLFLMFCYYFTYLE